jgi:hypothetical protein
MGILGNSLRIQISKIPVETFYWNIRNKVKDKQYKGNK